MIFILIMLSLTKPVLSENIFRIKQVMGLISEENQVIDKVFDISYEVDPEVMELQKILVDKGYYIGRYGPKKDGVDGKYGPFTKAAHEAFKEGINPKKYEQERPSRAQNYIGNIDENHLRNEFHFHQIPDGKNNFRSAQIPVTIKGKDFYGPIVDKYNIKTIIRLNGDSPSDQRHTSNHPSTSTSEEKKFAESKGIKFYRLSSRDDQDKVNSLLKQGNVLIHCAHGQDRTGGNVGGYLMDIKWGGGDTKKIWDYTTNLNGWKRMIQNNPKYFVKGGFLFQAQKFGVKDLEHAKKLSGIK